MSGAKLPALPGAINLTVRRCAIKHSLNSSLSPGGTVPSRRALYQYSNLFWFMFFISYVSQSNISKEYYYYLINKFQNKINTAFNIKTFPKNMGKFKTVYNVIITGVHNNKTEIEFKWLP